MKRSKINHLIKETLEYLDTRNFYLPAWGYWTLTDWLRQKNECEEIFERKLGWDVFSGGDDFSVLGAVLFTIRNGSDKDNMRPYCEKIIVMEKGQMIPYHYHKEKTEDIINRGGGDLAFALKMAEEENQSIDITVDGIKKRIHHGEEFILSPGESLTLYPYCYHKFYPKANKLLIGEVSKVNDDEHDNFFLEEIKRFPEIEEDEEIIYPLVNDYQKIIEHK